MELSLTIVECLNLSTEGKIGVLKRTIRHCIMFVANWMIIDCYTSDIYGPFAIRVNEFREFILLYLQFNYGSSLVRIHYK